MAFCRRSCGVLLIKLIGFAEDFDSTCHSTTTTVSKSPRSAAESTVGRPGQVPWRPRVLRGSLFLPGFRVRQDLTCLVHATCVGNVDVTADFMVQVDRFLIQRYHVLRLIVVIDLLPVMCVEGLGVTVIITQINELTSHRDLHLLPQSLNFRETAPGVRLRATGLSPHRSTHSPSSGGPCPRQTARRRCAD